MLAPVLPRPAPAAAAAVPSHAAASPGRCPGLPDSAGVPGPATRDRLRRLALVYTLPLLCGIALIELSGSDALRALGAGLVAPGGAFLAWAGLGSAAALAHLALAALVFLAFGVTLGLWFATGNVLAPPLLWVLAAAGGAAMQHGPGEAAFRTVYLVPALAATAFFILRTWRRQRSVQLRAASNAHLRTAHFEVHAAAAPELTPQELQGMRFILDRALQPLTDFDGFQQRDQFQTAALRYQLNFSGYALALMQARRMPAMGAWLDLAQRKLVLKTTDHRVWGYWLRENLWGNLCADANPLLRQNIMYRGFVATQMALYHTASGRREFRQPGCFVLADPDGGIHESDFDALAAGLERELTTAPLGLVACEPHWVYPLCNMISAVAIKSASRARWQRLEAGFRASLEREFVDARGNIVPCRSSLTGLALPAIGGAMPQALPCFFLNALMPDLALRQWLLLRPRLLAGKGGLNRRAFWAIDTGDYRRSRAAAYACTALAARELGDEEIATLCLAALDEECPGTLSEGVRHRERASVWAHAVELMARAAGRDGFQRMVGVASAVARGPHIAEAAYPEVLTAAARFEHGALHAVLYPGTAAAGRQRLGLAGLRPHTRYVCVGGVERLLASDETGRVALHVDLAGRTELRIQRLF